MGEIIKLPASRQHRPAPANPLADPKVRARVIELVDLMIQQNERYTATLELLLRTLSTNLRQPPAG